jgi:NAD(P)-dependent dehydrogenase (short-subunit alcohol dehydrogenase family)
MPGLQMQKNTIHTQNRCLTGKTALVTGGAQRLGRAMALALATNGAQVIVHYRSSVDAAHTLKLEIEQQGGKAGLMQADLSDAKAVEALLPNVIEQYSPVDILINNASIFEQQTLHETTEQTIQANMQIHAYAPLVLSRALASRNRPGHIVNLLDSRVRDYDQQHVPYHLSKRALMSLTRMLAMELAPAIAVNAVAPGLILAPRGEDEDYLTRLAHTNPLQRHGDPKDVAEAVLFLVQSHFITGQIIYVDGGRHMKGHFYG